MSVQDVIARRKSVRSYTGEALTQEELKALLLAAQGAPVGMHKYESLHISVVQDAELLAKIEEVANTASGRSGSHPLFSAPVLILVSSDFSSPRPNVDYSNAACIVENMALVATELDLGSCHIWGAIAEIADQADLLRELKVPEGFTPSCGLVVGKTSEKYEPRDFSKDHIQVDYVGA